MPVADAPGAAAPMTHDVTPCDHVPWECLACCLTCGEDAIWVHGTGDAEVYRHASDAPSDTERAVLDHMARMTEMPENDDSPYCATRK